MDRATIFYGQQPLETDLLRAQQFANIALGEVARAFLGSGNAVDGFVLSATAPASLSLTVGGGQVYTMGVVEATQWSSLPIDNRPLLRQGLTLNTSVLTFQPPSTVGFAQNFLIQVAYSESDTGEVVRPYYNAADPAVNFEGPGGDGNADSTVRQDGVSIGVKTGTAATVGTQPTPAPDPGYIGLYVVTLTQGQSQITSANWSKYSPSSFIPVRLPEIPGDVQNCVWNYAVGTGTASALLASIAPTPAALVAGMQVLVKSPFTNTGATTFNLNGLGNKAVLARDGTQLNPGDIVNGQIVVLSYNGSNWQLQSDRSAVAATFSIADAALWHIGTATGGTTAAMTTNLAPTPSASVNGLCMRVPISQANAASATLDYGFGPTSIIDNKTGNALIGGEMPAGFEADLMVVGTHLVLMNAMGQTGFPKLVQISASGNYTPSAGTKRIAVLATGPGGPGGSGVSNSNAGGGGGGESVLGFFDVSALTLPIACTIGAPTAPLVTGLSAGAQGPLGTPTTFGNLIQANAGQGGLCSLKVGSGNGALGGSGGTGGISFPGSPGSTNTAAGMGGNGGRSLRSAGGIGHDGNSPTGTETAANGGAAPGPGGGGGGGDSPQQGAYTGGAAGAGEILILEMSR